MIWWIELKSESHALNLWVWFSLFTLPIGHASRKPRPKISIDLIFQKKIYQERNGQDSFQSLTLIEFGLKIWLQSSSKHRWDFYLCHLCTSCRRNWTSHARYSSEVRTLPKYPNLGERSDHLGKYLGICKLTNHTLYTWIRQHKVQFYLNSSSACLK